MSELTKEAWETWTDRDSMWEIVRRAKLPKRLVVKMPLAILGARLKATKLSFPALDLLLDALDNDIPEGMKAYSVSVVSEATYLIETALRSLESKSISDWFETITLYALTARAVALVCEYTEGRTYAGAMAWHMAEELRPSAHEIRLAVPWEAIMEDDSYSCPPSPPKHKPLKKAN